MQSPVQADTHAFGCEVVGRACRGLFDQTARVTGAAPPVGAPGAGVSDFTALFGARLRLRCVRGLNSTDAAPPEPTA